MKIAITLRQVMLHSLRILITDVKNKVITICELNLSIEESSIVINMK